MKAFVKPKIMNVVGRSERNDLYEEDNIVLIPHPSLAIFIFTMKLDLYKGSLPVFDHEVNWPS